MMVELPTKALEQGMQWHEYRKTNADGCGWVCS